MTKTRINSLTLTFSLFLILIPVLTLADSAVIIPLNSKPKHIRNSWASLQISGNSARKYRSDDPIDIIFNSTGSARIKPNSGHSGNFYVTFPVTYYYSLFGSTAKLDELCFFYKTSSESTYISTILVRRQKGVCTLSNCYDSLLFSTYDRSCTDPSGCFQTAYLDDSSYRNFNYGSIYITLQLYFPTSSSWIDIGGLRLNMQYIPN